MGLSMGAQYTLERLGRQGSMLIFLAAGPVGQEEATLTTNPSPLVGYNPTFQHRHCPDKASLLRVNQGKFFTQ